MAWPSRPPPTLRPICVRLTTPTYLTVHKLQIASLPLSRPRWLIFQWLESNFLHKMKIMKGSYQKISFHSTWKKTFSKLRICKMPPTLMVSTMRPVHRVIPLPPSLDVIYLRPPKIEHSYFTYLSVPLKNGKIAIKSNLIHLETSYEAVFHYPTPV